MKTFNNIAQIKAEREIQRTNTVIYKLLGVLIGELDRLPIPRNQEPSEAQIYAVVKKLYEAAEYMASMDLSEEAKIEYAYLKDYIKTQLSKEAIKLLIINIKNTNANPNIGSIMQFFKTYYPGQYDGKLVLQIAKEIIN